MIIEELKRIKPIDGVIQISEVDTTFEKMYDKISKIEKRQYADDEVRLLPFASKLNPHKEEWNLRAKSFLRFKNYISKRKISLNILDLGCGNGWFASKLLNQQNHNFYCVDINLNLLKQGARIFSSENIKFIYADILSINLPKNSFDYIIMNSSIQYFSNLKILMRELFYLLNYYGEIHILDSQFYEDDEIEIVKSKNEKYFELMGCAQMKEKVFYHTFSNLKDFNHKFIYDPQTFTNKLLKIAFSKDSPYPWIVIRR